MDSYRKFATFWAVSLLVMVLAGCGGGGGTSISVQTGALSVSLTDAPASGEFDAVNVTISKVRVHQSAQAGDGDAGWSEITLDPARKVNLLDLQNGVLEYLGQTPLAAGHYTQLRLVLVANAAEPFANSVVPTGETEQEVALITPSAAQSGVKLIHQFDVPAGGLVDLTLDFDALKSIVARGNGTYALKPVIRVTPQDVSGGITGFIDAGGAGNLMVTAQLDGRIVAGAVPDAETGAFKLSPLVQSSIAGDYTVVITANGRASVVITDVPVTIQQDTLVSTSKAPIELTPSETGDITGNLAPTPVSATEVASVEAKQTFAGGTVTTVQSKNVPLSDAANGYTLTLPLAEPLLGQYTETLPILFLPQAAVAGKYIVTASAEGYTADPAQAELDISTTDKSQDFALTGVSGP